MAKKDYIARSKSRKKKRVFFLRWGFWLTLFVLGCIAAGVGWMVADHHLKPYRERAQSYDMERINDLEIPSIIVDRNGEEIGRFFVQNRSAISIDEVPEVFIQALTSGEDQRFFSHNGVDYAGIIRAAWLNYTGGMRQGASTITQQLARNAYNLQTEADLRGESEEERKIVGMRMRSDNLRKKNCMCFWVGIFRAARRIPSRSAISSTASCISIRLQSRSTTVSRYISME